MTVRGAPETDPYAAAVGAIYGAIESPTRWPEALIAIAACSGDSGAIFIYPRDDGSLGSIVTPGLEAVQAAFESSEWGGKDLRFERALERGYVQSGQCVTDRHLVTDEEIETHPYYVDLLRPHGLKYFAGLNISPAPNAAAALSVQRGPDRSPFSDEELAVVARLGRHVEAALRLSVRLVAAEAGVRTANLAQIAAAFREANGGVARAVETLGAPRGSEIARLLEKLAKD